MTIEQLRMAAYAALPVLLVLIGSVSIIREGHVGISVLFGKFCRILRPGLRLRLPWVERVFRVISLQLRSVELEFQAITGDQANVNFKALIVYTVANDRPETIMKAAFKFIDERSFMQTLIRSIEGSIRSFVALKKQSEILLLRREIVDEVNSHIEHELQGQVARDRRFVQAGFGFPVLEPAADFLQIIAKCADAKLKRLVQPLDAGFPVGDKIMHERAQDRAGTQSLQIGPGID